jgi:hypothetical protein
MTLALLALAAGLAAALVTPSSASAAGKPCWELVIDDWLDNGTINGQYKAACYQHGCDPGRAERLAARRRHRYWHRHGHR